MLIPLQSECKEKKVPASQYNQLVDDYNQCRELLIEANNDISNAQKTIDELAKKKCPSQAKEKLIIGTVCGFGGLAIGLGLGIGLVIHFSK